MDRLLKRQILNADPRDPFAQKHYKHWIKSFTSIVDAVEQSLRLPAAEQYADAQGKVVDKSALLHRYLSPDIFDPIEKSTTYHEGKAILHQTSLKQKMQLTQDIFHIRKKKNLESQLPSIFAN